MISSLSMFEHFSDQRSQVLLREARVRATQAMAELPLKGKDHDPRHLDGAELKPTAVRDLNMLLHETGLLLPEVKVNAIYVKALEQRGKGGKPPVKDARVMVWADFLELNSIPEELLIPKRGAQLTLRIEAQNGIEQALLCPVTEGLALPLRFCVRNIQFDRRQLDEAAARIRQPLLEATADQFVAPFQAASELIKAGRAIHRFPPDKL